MGQIIKIRNKSLTSEEFDVVDNTGEIVKVWSECIVGKSGYVEKWRFHIGEHEIDYFADKISYGEAVREMGKIV